MADSVPEPEEPKTAASDEDPEQTDQERLDWLRAHGVTVDMPEDRKTPGDKAAEKKAAEGPMVTFKYVAVPADDSVKCTTLECTVPACTPGDALKDYLKPCFSDGAAVDATTLREQYAGTNAADVSAAALQNVSMDGSVEVFPICRPGPTNGRVGVFLYLDEIGMLKKLPPNNRCNALAKACGMDGVNFYGDMFMGRVRAAGFGEGEYTIPNKDFTVEDMSSDSEWMKGAPHENVAFEQHMGKFREQFKGNDSINLGEDAIEQEGKLKAEEDYFWSQTSDEVEITVPVKGAVEGLKAKMLDVSVMPRKIKVMLKGAPESLIEIDLCNSIRPDDSTWSITTDLEPAAKLAGHQVAVEIVMEKVQGGKNWPKCSA